MAACFLSPPLDQILTDAQTVLSAGVALDTAVPRRRMTFGRDTRPISSTSHIPPTSSPGMSEVIRYTPGAPATNVNEAARPGGSPAWGCGMEAPWMDGLENPGLGTMAQE